MNRFFGFILLVGTAGAAHAQQPQASEPTAMGVQLLTLDSCRAMALRNNKQLNISKVKQDVARNVRRSARTKYLPHISAIGAYEHTSEEISILNDQQKHAIGNIGTAATGVMQNGMNVAGNYVTSITGLLGQMGIPTDYLQKMAGELQQNMATTSQKLGGALNTVGQRIVDDFRTDTRNIWAGSVLFTQPVFMGGAIIAANRMADLGEEMAASSTDAKLQATIYSTDQAYWQVVSLKHKQRLAQAYLELVRQFSDNVQKMIAEGVATRSDGLSVEVKVNEAEMTLTRVNDGLVLSRMLLCQTIGLPVDEQILLADEDKETLATPELAPAPNRELAMENRPELKMLQTGVKLSEQLTRLLKAGHLPQVALTGGYAVSNPNVLNGFEKKFAGFWNVGVLVRVPIWNWGDVAYKVRASKGATAIATLELEEAREKIGLQLSQTSYKVDEANKRLVMAQSSIRKAEENLRTANLGFSEGVITPTVVMEAQTAWLQAKSQMIDAEIDLRLSQVDLRKAQGTLSAE